MVLTAWAWAKGIHTSLLGDAICHARYLQLFIPCMLILCALLNKRYFMHDHDGFRL